VVTAAASVREPGSAKVEETRRMSDLLCAPYRPGGNTEFMQPAWRTGGTAPGNLKLVGGLGRC